jgi:hypothetical protein
MNPESETLTFRIMEVNLTALRHILKKQVNFAFKVGGLSIAALCFIAIAKFLIGETTEEERYDVVPGCRTNTPLSITNAQFDALFA